jgi:hypothetical protein
MRVGINPEMQLAPPPARMHSVSTADRYWPHRIKSVCRSGR